MSVMFIRLQFYFRNYFFTSADFGFDWLFFIKSIWWNQTKILNIKQRVSFCCCCRKKWEEFKEYFMDPRHAYHQVTHAKISTHAHFMDPHHPRHPRQNIMDPRHPCHPRQSLTHSPTVPTPTTLFSRFAKYMPEKRRQNLSETSRWSYCCNQEEWVEEFLDDKGAFYNGSESDDGDNDDENYNENMEAVVRRCSSK